MDLSLARKKILIYNLKLNKFILIDIEQLDLFKNLFFNINLIFFLIKRKNFLKNKFSNLKKRLKFKKKIFLNLKILKNFFLKFNVLRYVKIFLKFNSKKKFFNIFKFNLVNLNFFECMLLKLLLLFNFKVKKLNLKILTIFNQYKKNFIKSKILLLNNNLINKKKRAIVNFLIRSKFLCFLFISYFELNFKNWLNIFDYKNKLLFLFYQFFIKIKTLKKLKDLKKLKIYKKLIYKKLKYLKITFYKYEYYKFFNTNKTVNLLTYKYTKKLLKKNKQYKTIKNKMNKISLSFIIYIKKFNKNKNFIGFCVLTKSRFNFFLTITDYLGNVLISRNLGFLHTKQVDLQNKSIYYSLGNSCNSIINEKNIYLLNLKICLPKLKGIQIKSSIFGLINSGFEIKNVEYVKLRSHNGIKNKKSKRL